MNDLLQAAKAVIDATDTGDRWCAIANLRAAVERAEKQEAVGFDEYWESVDHYRYCEDCAKDAWTGTHPVRPGWINCLSGSDSWNSR